jgi:hypothetical protein
MTVDHLVTVAESATATAAATIVRLRIKEIKYSGASGQGRIFRG